MRVNPFHRRKPFIDEIAKVLVEHYGSTGEELAPKS
jgi:hypothetical protein